MTGNNRDYFAVPTVSEYEVRKATLGLRERSLEGFLLDFSPYRVCSLLSLKEEANLFLEILRLEEKENTGKRKYLTKFLEFDRNQIERLLYDATFLLDGNR